MPRKKKIDTTGAAIPPPSAPPPAPTADLSCGGLPPELVPYDPFNPDKLADLKIPEGAVQYSDIPDAAGILADLPVLTARHAYLSDQIAALEAQKDTLRLDIEARLLVANAERALVGRYSIVRSQPGPRRTFDPERPLKQGIPAEQVDGWYKETQVKASIRITDISK